MPYLENPLPGPAGRAWIEAVDRRLATVPAMLRDLARVAAESGARVVRAAEFAVLPDADAALSLDGRVDQLLLEGRGAVAEHRGNA